MRFGLAASRTDIDQHIFEAFQQTFDLAANVEQQIEEKSFALVCSLKERDDLRHSKELLNINITQIMERIAPAAIDVKTGKHKKNYRPKSNIKRRWFDLM